MVAAPMAFGTGILIKNFIHRGGTQVDDFTKGFCRLFFGKFLRQRNGGGSGGPRLPSHFSSKSDFILPSYATKIKLVRIFSYLFEILFHFSRFFLATNGPERFKKLREAGRKNFHLVAPPKTSVVTSYDQEQES